MLDADDSLANKCQSIKDKLSDYNYQFPTFPDVRGTIIDRPTDQPKLRFWLMSNNQDSGKLEDFCVELAEPLSLKFAEECVEETHIEEVTTFKPIDRSKAIIHTYLAWQDEPGRPMGQAMKFTDRLIRLFG